VGPLRTWDTPRQTSQATTTDPSKSIQIRYQTFHTDTGEVETKLPASELPVTVPTQVKSGTCTDARHCGTIHCIHHTLKLISPSPM